MQAPINSCPIQAVQDRLERAMHTIYDQLIPPTYGIVNFENMVHQKGKDQYFISNFTNGQGHCNFTDAQTGLAFDNLRAWVKTGQKARSGMID